MVIQGHIGVVDKNLITYGKHFKIKKMEECNDVSL